jgi:4-diphosphocytidyl-2-C-methyl-D-erythritol kinase
MISFPNAKINLGLRVQKKRPDGFHEIESCFQPIQWNDILEIVESGEENLTFSGLKIPGPKEDNLCWKAYMSIKEKYSIPPVHIHLHKVIPMGAGVGGGSSDAAFTIKTLNNLFSLYISIEEMETFATQIGSDCPFFIKNETAIATGRGTILNQFNPELSGMKIILVNPGLPVSTAKAYGGISIVNSNPGDIQHILYTPVEQWKDALKNDFEEYVFQKHPEIQILKNKLYEAGAVYASMTGSGATVFGIFNEWSNNLDLPEDYICWQGEL